jgi:hypothetical protein
MLSVANQLSHEAICVVPVAGHAVRGEPVPAEAEHGAGHQGERGDYKAFTDLKK